MRVPTLGRRLYSLLMFLLVSVLGGVLMAGLFIPTAGVASESTKQISLALNSLPEELKVLPPSEGSRVLMANGEELTNFFDQNRKVVPLSEIAPIMRKAQVGIEDQRFYKHGALDLRGTLRALVRSGSGNMQGGSTLTQQYVKLALLYDAQARNDVEGVQEANNRTVARKVLELRYAVALEKQLSKDQILENYLNMAYFGDRSYGVEAAAQHYFGIKAKDLSLPQAAMLAGLVRNPFTSDPIRHPAIAEERMRNVLDRLADPDVGVISAAEAATAKKYKFDKSKVKPIPDNGCTNSKYQHLCWYVYQVLTKQTPSLGKDAETRSRTLRQAGLTIQTEIDPRFQDAAQKSVSNFIAPTDPVVGIITMVEPSTGLIKAAAQSRYQLGDKPGQTWKNWFAATQLQGEGGFFGGSTFKAFTLVAALRKGLDPVNHRIDSPKDRDFNGVTFQGCTEAHTIAPKEPGAEAWVVNTSSAGNYNMYDGATHSSNTFFVALQQETGICEAVKAAEDLGLKRGDGAGLVSGKLPNGKLVSEPSGELPTFTLGTTKVTPLSLTSAYATLANRGKRCDPIILKSISDNKGRSYAVPSANCTQAIDAKIADRVNDILHGPFSAEGTATKAQIPGYVLSGKTGTVTANQGVVMAGYTPDLAASTFIVPDTKHPDTVARMQEYKKKYHGAAAWPIDGLRVHGAQIRVQNTPNDPTYNDFSTKAGYELVASSGYEAGGALWRPAMTEALNFLPRHTQFVPPEGIQPTPAPGNESPAPSPSAVETTAEELVEVPNCAPLSLDECRAAVEAAGFRVRVSDVFSSRPAGRFLGIPADDEGMQPKGSTIRLLMSKGQDPANDQQTTTAEPPATSTPQPPQSSTSQAPREAPTAAPTTTRATSRTTPRTSQPAPTPTGGRTP